jgi:hypothetical protein
MTTCESHSMRANLEEKRRVIQVDLARIDRLIQREEEAQNRLRIQIHFLEQRQRHAA